MSGTTWSREKKLNQGKIESQPELDTYLRFRTFYIESTIISLV